MFGIIRLTLRFWLFPKGIWRCILVIPGITLRLKQDNPNFNFQIVPVPQLPSQNVNMASYWAEGVSVKVKHQKEALLFMQYLAKKTPKKVCMPNRPKPELLVSLTPELI